MKHPSEYYTPNHLRPPGDGLFNDPTPRINRAANAFNKTMDRIVEELFAQFQTTTAYFAGISNEEFVWPKGVRKSFLNTTLERLMFVHGPDNTVFVTNGQCAFGPFSSARLPKNAQISDLMGVVPAEALKGGIPPKWHECGDLPAAFVEEKDWYSVDQYCTERGYSSSGWALNAVYFQAALDFIGVPRVDHRGLRYYDATDVRQTLQIIYDGTNGSPIVMSANGYYVDDLPRCTKKVAVIMPMRVPKKKAVS